MVDGAADNDTLTLTLVEGPITYDDKVFFDNFSETVCFLPDTAGVYTFVWRVTNRYGNSDIDTVSYTVYLNIPPVIDDQWFGEQVCFVPYTRLLPVQAYDPDCDSLRFELVSGPGSIDAYTGLVTYEAQGSGVTEFLVAVWDECTSDTAAVYDSVYLNLPPYLTTDDYRRVLCAPEEICFDIIGVDPEGGPLMIYQNEGPGEFTTLNDTSGQTCFMPADVDSATYMFVYCVIDQCPYGDGEPLEDTPPCDKDTVYVTVIIDQPPVIDCPEARQAFICDTDTLCFEVDATDDGPYGQLSFAILSGNATIDNRTVCVELTEPGQLEVVIEVADSCGHADTCTVPVSVNANRPPVVTLAPDMEMTLCQPQTVCFDAYADDPDFNLADVSVNIGYYDDGTDRACIEVDEDGVYTVIMTATDSCGLTDSDTTQVTIHLNEIPIVQLGDDFDVTLCDPEPACFPAEISDDNTQMFYLSLGEYNAQEGNICFTPDTPGVYTIVARLTDDCDITAEDTIRVGVDLNITPVISGFEDTTVFTCNPQYVCLPVEISDPDQNISQISVSRGSYSEGQVCFVPYFPGEYEIILSVTDKCGTIEDTAVVTVMTENITLVCPGDTSVFLCEPDTLCFPIQGVPEGAEVVVGGTASWWDEATQSVCFYSDCCLENKLTVQVIGECDTYTCSFTVQIQTNSKPLVILPQDTSLFLCEPTQLCFPVGINDLDDNVVEITVDGAVYDDYRGTVCLTPDTSGVYAVTVTATDECGAADTDVLYVTVDINDAPILTSLVEDSVFRLCELEPIQLQFLADDLDENIVEIWTSHGSLVIASPGEPPTLEIMPEAFGDFCVTIIATDKCGLTDTLEICITIEQGDFVSILCPTDLPVTELCQPETICLPITIDGPAMDVTTDLGAFADGELCFPADTSGLYTITMIATAECNADTCIIKVPVDIAVPIDLTCPPDTSVFLCEPGTLALPFDITGDYTDVVASGGAVIDQDQVIVTLDEPGQYAYTITAFGPCDSTDCTFSVTASFNSDPTVAANDTTTVLCELGEVCIPFAAEDADENIVSVTSSLGTVAEGQVCFTPEAFDDYSITITATDECGAEAATTVTVSVMRGDWVELTCPTVEPVTNCDIGQVCFPLEVSGRGYQLYTSLGEYADGQVCFDADTTGIYDITIIGDAGCNSDTCQVSVAVTVIVSAEVVCDAADTTVFFCTGPQTLSFPVTIFGDDPVITVTPDNAYYEDGLVYVTISEAGVTVVDVVAENVCAVDTCSFAITAAFNRPPTLVAGNDTSFTTCELTELCFSLEVGDPDDNLVEVRANQGLVNDTIICFTPPAFGEYQIVITATDACDATASDTINISVTEGDHAMIDCPGYMIPVAIETPDTARVPLAVTPPDAEVSVSPFGYYDDAVSYTHLRAHET